MYQLAGGIYFNWPIFAKPMEVQNEIEEKRYKKLQEGLQKDIEQCFRVLQATILCLRTEKKLWYLDQVMEQRQACIILKIMIVKMKKEGDLDGAVDGEGNEVNALQELLLGGESDGSSEIGGVEQRNAMDIWGDEGSI